TLAERGQRVRTHVAADGVVVAADAVHVTLVLAQLIQNASVAAPDSADIDVYTRADDAAAEVIVRKPLAHQESFDPVHALESLRAPAHTHGIALATARRLIELQRGSLTAGVDPESRAAEFVVRLVRSAAAVASRAVPPVAVDSAPSQRPARAQSQTGVARRILLVDDNA